MRNFSIKPPASGVFDFGSGFFARLIILALGFALVFWFQLWGLTAYLAVTVIFCRYAANTRGLTVGSYPLSKGHSAPKGHVYIYCIFVVLGFSFVSVFLRNLDIVNSALLTWNKAAMFSGMSDCTSTSLFSCKALYVATGTYAFLTPVLFAICLHYLIAISQYRLGVSRASLFKVFLFTTIIFLAILLLPMHAFFTSGPYGIGFILFLFYCQLMLIMAWVRLSGE